MLVILSKLINLQEQESAITTKKAAITEESLRWLLAI